MLVIELSEKVEENRGKTKDGREYESRHQLGFLVTDLEKRRCRIRLTGAPYAPGKYTIGTGTFLTDQYHNLTVARDIELVAVK